MRFFAPPANAEQWYDRSPLTIADGVFAIITNDAGGTYRLTYTVPAGRRAFISALSMALLCSTSNAGERCQCTAYVTPSGGSREHVAGSFRTGTGISEAYSTAQPPALWLDTGDKLEIHSLTVGVVAVYQAVLGYAGIEFDA